MRIHLVLLLAAGLVFAPHALAQKRNGKAPAAGQQRRIKTIFDYKTELGMTDAQETQIKDALKKLATYLKECQTRMVRNLKEVKTMRDQDADIEKIKPFLRSNADIQVEMGVADIQASRQINRVLKAEQLAKWRQVQQQSAAAAAAAQNTTKQAVPSPAADGQ